MPPQDTTLTTKRCTGCGEVKPLSEFHRWKLGKDGHRVRCKPCNTREANQWARANPARYKATLARLYVENREQRLARSLADRERNGAYYNARKRAAYHADPARIEGHARKEAERETRQRDAKERRKRYETAYRHQTRERREARNAERADEIREYMRRYHIAHRAEALARAQAWAKANPERYRLLANNTRRRRQALKAGAARRDFTAAQWVEMVTYYGGRCAYCHQPCDSLTQDHMTPISQRGDHTAANIVPACNRCNSRKGAKNLLEYLVYLRP